MPQLKGNFPEEQKFENNNKKEQLKSKVNTFIDSIIDSFKSNQQIEIDLEQEFEKMENLMNKFDLTSINGILCFLCEWIVYFIGPPIVAFLFIAACLITESCF